MTCAGSRDRRDRHPRHRRALATDADVVAYFGSSDYRYREAADDIARCLRAGRDVVTTSLVSFCWPPAAEPDLRELLEDACTAGGTRSSTAASSQAGSTTSCRSCSAAPARDRPDHDAGDPRLLTIAQPHIMYDFMGFAHPPDTRRRCTNRGGGPFWAPVVGASRPRRGLPRPRRDTLEQWIAPESYETASGPLPAGTVGGMRFRLVGMLAARSGSSWSTSPAWASTRPRLAAHPSPLGGYRVILEGMPTYTVDIEMHGRGSNMRGLSFATFMRPLNAIPAVVAAPPGILSAHDLPMVTGVTTGAEWTGRARLMGGPSMAPTGARTTLPGRARC